MNNHLLLSLVARSLVPPLLALLVVMAWRKASASNRRLIWLMSFVALAILPLALFKLPSASVVLPHRELPTTMAVSSVTTANFAGTNFTRGQTPTTASTEISPTRADALITPTKATPYRPLQVGVLLWAIGSFLVLAYWMTGLVRLSRLRMAPITDTRMLAEMEVAGRRLGLTRTPRLFDSPQICAPMMFGHFRPRVVLPPAAASWNSDALRAVLLHECAHIRHGDWLGHVFSRWLTAAYWFNPMAWLAAKQFRSECEAAADDAVLLSGVPAGSYASELLRIAANARPSTFAGSLAFFDVDSLKKRIERILQRNRSRVSASRRSAGLALLSSLALSAVCAFSFQVVDGPLQARNGRADLGEGRYVRIVAIVRHTVMGDREWNMRGEPLPNSIPLPDRPGRESGANKDHFTIVFATNEEVVGIEADGIRNGSFVQTTTSTSGDHYHIQRLDGEPLVFADYVGKGSDFASIHCRVFDQAPRTPAESIRAMKHAKVVVFDRVPLSPAGQTLASVDLDVSHVAAPGDTGAVGALIGITDISHPEWGFWRPDGTPLPPISGATGQVFGGGMHAQAPGLRRLGFLFRGRPDSADGVASSDASGMDLRRQITFFHTPSGRYDLNEVDIRPDFSVARLAAKVPKADRVVEHLALSPLTPSKQNAKVFQFFATRIGKDASCFGFQSSLRPAGNDVRRSLQLLGAHGLAPQFFGVATDWVDGAIAVSTKHPQQIVGANVLEHGFDYYSYDYVNLYPNSRAHS